MKKISLVTYLKNMLYKNASFDKIQKGILFY
jgi:hypothetical protein